jgi:hypothetical protein
MATFTAARAADAFPVYVPMGAGNLGVAYGSYTFAAEQAAAETLAICKVPKGAVVLGGWLRAGDMDTGSETLDIDVGYAANGAVAADPDAFGNFGVLNGAAVTNVVPEGGIMVPLMGTLKDGPVTFTAETTILVTFVDDAATFQAGTVTVVVFYVVP